MNAALRDDLQPIMLLLFAEAMQLCERAAGEIAAETLTPVEAERQVAEKLVQPVRDAARDMLRAYLRQKLLERAP